MAVKSLLEMASQRAEGPFFLYDMETLESHLSEISVEGVKLWYACKANPLGAILDACAGAGFSFDVASGGELAQVLGRGVKGKDILVTGPSRTARFLNQALDAQVETFVIESPRQLSLLEAECQRRGVSVRALLRLQLEWEGAEASVLGGSKITPFGVDADIWRVSRPQSTKSVEIIGFHAFQWGNILSISRLENIWSRVAEAAKSLANELGIELKVLDLGGGIGIPYSASDPRMHWQEVAKALTLLRRNFSLPQIWLELGRFAVGEVGYYVAQVVDRKTVRSKELLILDGGINHLARPALVNEAFPADLLRDSSARKTLFGVHGPLCTSLDHFGDYELPADIEPGDRIFFRQCGAYGFTESMPYFLGHDLPAEFVWQRGELLLARPNLLAASWMK